MSTEQTPKTAEVIKSTKLALRDTDPILIAKAQLEISACQMHYLEAIDWKLWEIYSMLKKDSEKQAATTAPSAPAESVGPKVTTAKTSPSKA